MDISLALLTSDETYNTNFTVTSPWGLFRDKEQKKKEKNTINYNKIYDRVFFQTFIYRHKTKWLNLAALLPLRQADLGSFWSSYVNQRLNDSL